MLLVIDREVFGSKIEPMRPRLDFEDDEHRDPAQVGQALNLISMAQAASIETKVRMLNPEAFEGPEVQAEVERIKQEQGVAVADPTGAPAPNFGT